MDYFAILQAPGRRREVALPLVTAEKPNFAVLASASIKVIMVTIVDKIRTARMGCFATLQAPVRRREVALPSVTAEKPNFAEMASASRKVIMVTIVDKIPTARMDCFATLQAPVRRREVALPLVTAEKPNFAKIASASTKVIMVTVVHKIPTARMDCFATLQA